MKWIIDLANFLLELLVGLKKIITDPVLCREMLASVGATPTEATQGRLKTLSENLDKLKAKTDEKDKFNISDYVSVAMFLGETYLIFSAVLEMLKTCDYFGLKNNGTEESNADRVEASINAARAISRLITLIALKKDRPALAAWFEMIGIFGDESTETRRALHQVFPFEFLRPTGDTTSDERLLWTKSGFIVASVATLVLKNFIKSTGQFLFNFGYELPVDKDKFPNAASVTGRLVQMQFVPGPLFFSNDDEALLDELPSGIGRDAVISFATIPLAPDNPVIDPEPKGYQYMLGLNLNPWPPGSASQIGITDGRFSLFFRPDLVANFFWGDGIDFTILSGIGLAPGPIVEAKIKAKKSNGENTSNDVNNGEIYFAIEKALKQVSGVPKDDIEFKVKFDDLSLGLSGEGRDGFLRKILPDKGAQINTSLTVRYSAVLNKLSVEGLDGNDGLFLQFSIGKSIFGKLRVETLYLGLRPSFDAQKAFNGVTLEGSAHLKLILGPFSMNVDRVGLHSTLSFPENADGNLGAANLSLGLKPPTGIGFLVKASVVNGGGFLSIDPENHQYYGAGELNIEFKGETVTYCLTLKIVAVIVTQLPDGKKGFSFLLMASLEFNPPPEIGLGFKLKGVGVMVATNRAMDLDALQLAVKDDRLNSILFPTNPVGNAPTIVKSMNSLFPVIEDRYVFAIMARIGWGSNKLVDLKIGLFLEVPEPIKIALIGVLQITEEVAGKKVLHLQVNFITAIDFGKKIFSIDAAVYNSKILIFDIRGEMVVRYRWGNEPVFLLAVGGWHPDFQVPGGLNLPANLKRISIALLEDDNPSLVLSCYVAITTNTLQAGFAIDFKMKWSKFRLEAGLSVDALFHRDPFYFIVDFEGKLRIYWGDSRLAGITVKGEFSGMNPWRIKGSATFEIWIWDYDVDFDKSTGEKLESISQEVDALPLIQKAIQEKGNWQSFFADGRVSNIILRSTEEDAQDSSAGDSTNAPLRVDPLAHLEVRQQVAPLGIRIDKLSFQKVKGARKFDLVASAEAGDELTHADVKDFFSPAMFLELNDADKLSRKSYELLNAGRSFGDSQSLSCGPAQVSEIGYDSTYFDPMALQQESSETKLRETNFQRWVANNSIARSPEGKRLRARREANLRKPVPNEEAFVVIDAATGIKVPESQDQKTMAEAYDQLWTLQKSNPSRKINVVRRSEVITQP